MKFSLICASMFSFLLIPGLKAQSHVQCGTDEMHQRLFQEHPEYNAGITRANSKLQQFTSEYLQQPHAKDGDPYIIPVVFHVIHNYGPENISDAQIHDALRQVNIQFRKLNGDTSDIVQEFKSRAADCNIEFRLAQLDPDGNCTSGITRTVSPLTKPGNHDVKSLIHWPPDKYLNVYICNQAAGLAGHAMLPSAADTIPQWDGIVMQHSYVGTIGTSEYFRRTVLTHEIGHYLNLQHIWGGNNVPEYYYLPVASGGNCAFDDDVADTPNTIGWQTCDLNGVSCGALNNVQNYMDYAYCALMFTEGQKQRMHAALNSPVANRNNLWKTANLIATGTDDVTYHFCGAKFDSDKKVICESGSVNFTDVSYHGITDRKWTFAGGTASSTTDSLISVVYNVAGSYGVTLKVSNGDDTLEVVLDDYITVLPSEGNSTGIDEGFENSQHYASNWVAVDNGTNNLQLTSTAFESSQALKLNNFDLPVATTYEFYCHPVDVSGLTSLAISFDWAYGRIENTGLDILQVMLSNNCGQTWSPIKSYLGSSSLKTVSEFVTGPFIPANESEWKNSIITNIPASYLTENLMVKFKFDNKGNNNFYIDNIQLGHPDQLSLNQLAKQNIEIYPNPANETITLDLGEKHGVQLVSIYNLAGQLVKKISSIDSSSVVNLDVSDLTDGYYLIKIDSNRGQITVPQVINH